MHPLVAIGYFVIFAVGTGGGVFLGAALQRSRMRNEAYFRAALENERTKGRIEGMKESSKPRGLEPPKANPWA